LVEGLSKKGWSSTKSTSREMRCDGKKGHSIDNLYAQDYTLEKHTQQTKQLI
jgi:hypothetical protein